MRMTGLQQHCALVLLAFVVVEAGLLSAAASPATAQQPIAAVQAGKAPVAQPLWLQDAVRDSNQPGLSSRRTPEQQAKQPSAQAPPGMTVLAAPYILLQRAHTVKHTHKVSAAKDATVKIMSRGMRSGVLYRTSTISQGQTATITVKVPEGNEYLGVGVFAWDLEPTANIDISLSLQGEFISESNNPAGLDDFLEAREGVLPGEYTVTVTATALPKATTIPVYVWLVNESNKRAEIATPLPVQVSPNPVQLTSSPHCCSVTLSVGDIQVNNLPVNRYIGMLQYTGSDGKPLPGAPPTMVYLL